MSSFVISFCDSFFIVVVGVAAAAVLLLLLYAVPAAVVVVVVVSLLSHALPTSSSDPLTMAHTHHFLLSATEARHL